VEESYSFSGRGFLKGQIARELMWILGPEAVETSYTAAQAAAQDWSWMSRYFMLNGHEVPGPDFVVKPKNHADVERVVRLAGDYGIPVIPRGGGTGTQGGTFAPYGGIAIDLTGLNRIIEIDEESLVLTVESGLDGPTLEKTLNEHGLMLPHYPGAYHMGATVGGYVAARGSGVLSTKYGKAEDMVMRIKAVVAPGRTVETLPVPSHATGPDLLQAFVGSEGTLGVLTELTMRLDPLPETRKFLSFSFPNIFAGIEAGRLIMTNRLRPAVIRLYDELDSQKLADWVGTPFTGTLMLIMCDGPEGLVDYEIKAIEALCLKAAGTSLGPSVGEIWWEGKYEPYAPGKLPQPPMLYGTFDTVARFRDVPAIYMAKKARIETEFAEYGARYSAHFSHWFDWGTMIYDRFYIDNVPEDPAKALELHDRVWEAGVEESLRHGGTVNEHHGIGLKLGRFMRPQLGTMFDLIKEMRRAWDPQGIMNPGKLGFGPPSSRL